MNLSGMKRIGIYLFIGTVLCACSGSDDRDLPLPDVEKTPVVLSAGLPVKSRAVINTGDRFTAGVGGWETAGTAADYTAAATWSTTAAITASASVRTVELAEKQHYSDNDAIRTYMQAWYPMGELSDGKVSFDNPDGTVDAMMAGEVSGSKEDNTGKVLNFTHRTTQLKFKVVADPSLPQGTTLKRISVKGVRLPMGFNLAAGKVVFEENPGALTVPGLATPLEIPGEAAAAGEPVMVMPMTGNTVGLEIETSEATYSDVVATIDDDDDFVEGKAYVITLTFRGQSSGQTLGLSAIVTEWTHGTGSAEIK